ncbi:beige/BEACH domain-containing protein [Microdochium bolleyi]|uniref:Beige protein homolog 1 n=1 Tax=Microdochium bolleyi TaxID=196109 RepID=A0A136JAH5_9PEZI|nr:beige/BEACH domain-containing protein [Microdochium bolleyi]
MSLRPSRYRSSTSASKPLPVSKATEVFQRLLDDIATAANPSENGFPDIERVSKQLARVQQHLAAFESPSSVQDDFRHLHGFQRLFDTLRAFSGFYNPSLRTQDEKEAFFTFLENALGLLAVSFRNHPGNRRYFRARVEGGGWEALEQAIASIGLGGSGSDTWTVSQLFGKLLSFALGNSSVDELCCEIALSGAPLRRDASTTSQNDGDEDNASDDGTMQDEQVKAIEVAVAKVIGPSATLQNPEITRMIMDFWESMPRGSSGQESITSLLVLKIFAAIIAVSEYNLNRVHEGGVLSRLLKLAFDDESHFTDPENKVILDLCRALMSCGFNDLSDAQKLILNPSPRSSDFCLEMTDRYSNPPFVQFDLSLHGHSSIELPSLGRPFPPQQAQGYTFTAWFRVDNFDPSCHTTLFGVFDSTQTCFLLAYLEKDTRNFILQTSVRSSRPSVRFKSYTFKENKWYHVAIVHRRPKTITASKASLYVNGEFVEQLKAAYPSQPPLSSNSTESFASFASSSNKTMPVQAFLGTPKDLSGLVGPGLVKSKWSLASAHVFEDALSDEFLSVPSRLGPQYQGNFQDCLGAFQTYKASAALGLQNELLSTGKEADSDIMKVIRHKAAYLIPEQRILLSIMPSSIFSETRGFGDSQLFRALSRGPAHTLTQMVLKAGTGIAINTALPSINDALVRSNGVAILAGNPVVGMPQLFDDALWRLAGFTPLALKLVDRASTVDTLLQAVEMVFKCINSSWRNSEAMESAGGYQVLALLLRTKLGFTGSTNVLATFRLELEDDEKDKLCFRLLSLVLDFVGYKHRDPLDSVIINPLAYRILLVDFDGWRKCTPIIQELYYKQFVSFAVRSKYHQYNNRRLLRMRIVKRLLDAIKSEPLPENVMQYFMGAIESLVRCGYNTDVHRTIALFITYAFHTPSKSLPRTPKPGTPGGHMTPMNAARKPTLELNGGAHGAVTLLNRRQIGTRILEMYCQLLCDKGNDAIIRKFAKTVTNKWLLYLLTEDDAEIVVYGSKILARLLVVHGSSYISKFSGKTGGFCIMAHRLKRWWNIPTLWPICFSILFGYDVADIDFDKNFDFFTLIECFGNCKVMYPDALPIITGMMEAGLKDILRNQEDPESPSPVPSTKSQARPLTRPHARSMSYQREAESPNLLRLAVDRLDGDSAVLQTVIRFISDLYTRSVEFRDFALSSDYVRLLLAALYPVLVNTDPVSPETELSSGDSALTFEGGDVIIRPVGGPASVRPVIRTATPEPAKSAPTTAHRGSQLRKASSFILLTSSEPARPSSARINHIMSPKKKISVQNHTHAALEGISELVINVFVDQLLVRKEFPGFGLFLKTPPGFQEHQAYFSSYILRNTISHLSTSIKFDWKVLSEPRVLTNMARFCLHMVEAIFEGWFLNGTEAMLEFAGMLLEHLQKPEVSKLKAVRLCSQAVTTIRASFLKLVLLRLSEVDETHVTELAANSSMDKILYWLPVVLDTLTVDDDYMKLFWYQLYTKLVDDREQVKIAAINVWRIMLVQKPDDCASLFRLLMNSDQVQLTQDFQKLTELDNDAFVEWVAQNRPSLDVLFFTGISRAWEDFVGAENQRTRDTARSRLSKRRDLLRRWHLEVRGWENIMLRHDMANSAWMKSIYSSEHFKHQRFMQDQQDDTVYYTAQFGKMKRDLSRPGAVLYDGRAVKWKLDRTEGRNRMRLRLLPDLSSGTDQDYQPKRKTTDQAPASALKLNTSLPLLRASDSIARSPASAHPAHMGGDGTSDASLSLGRTRSTDSARDPGVIAEDDFELIDDPNDPNEAEDGFEDKNRRVMRRLAHGDLVQHVYNTSRIIGLEACEGILLIGKNELYLMDNFFQCADGEIVSVWDAPAEERDPFSQIVTGAKSSERRPTSSTQDSRSWRWHDVVSLSKRRFLFRDVAIEIFFTDGRSYLLTARNPSIRDEMYAKLSAKTPHTAGANLLPNPEDAWRLESLKVVDDSPQTLGSKFGSIFNQTPWTPVMRRWQRGEISNFHYLMLVNTMAGRTFNDLTQYPVFPWVLADYTSEELDLSNPATFRDLSKPMGAQTARRQADYTSRYNSLAEIGETPFHYGTHYSSAMIVASYLIRLPPFVQSYILLQGGSFDHADRLFFSIEGSWRSAAQDNGSDVRELIPEFFCLPDFLTNVNGYNFGERQGSRGHVNHVELPPWAKGDPKIFIAKHREALESPYVSQHLHAWIDLIFGYKQLGDLAVENLNVFHHLSYYGAKDLDNITDTDERHATTSIIHNFGQTPHQVFTKAHPPREHFSFPARRLDVSSEFLARMPHPVLESRERVAMLEFSKKYDRLICSSPFRLNLPPLYDKYLEWGFADNSIRFFFNENRRSAGVNENLHIGQISCVTVAGSKTLITAGEDCVITVHDIQTHAGKPVELHQRSTLTGHKTPVTTIAVSKAFSTLLTVSLDGHAFLWDLNRLDFIRKLPTNRIVECAKINDVSGEILLCSGSNVSLYTLNGDLLLDQNVCSEHDDYVHSCAFYEGSGNEWLQNFLVFTGHKRGRVNIWKRVITKSGKWTLELVRRLDHADTRSETGANSEAAITCITPMHQVVYTGDDDGRVYEWTLIQRER